MSETRKEALLEAAQAALDDAREKAVRNGARRRESSLFARRLLLGSGAVLFVASIYLLVARPHWFFEPAPVPETVEMQEASVRLMLVREAHRIRRWRADNAGNLPATLAEAGSPVRGVKYERPGDGTFVLSAPHAGAEIRLSSTDSLPGFIGGSFSVLRQRDGGTP